MRGLRRLGFGAVETGTVTPLPAARQCAPARVPARGGPGGDQPLRAEQRRAAAFVARLARLPRGGVPVGANVGINKDGADPERDYPRLVAAVAPYVDYIVINVSSPNTPGLRDLQGEAQLRGILDAIAAAGPRRPPLLVKIAPDLSDAGLEAVVETAAAHGAQGLIIGNTTVDRPETLRSASRGEAGGLSGPPLMERSTRLLARAHRARTRAPGPGRVRRDQQRGRRAAQAPRRGQLRPALHGLRL